MDPASFLLSGGAGGLDLSSASSSSTGPITTGGVKLVSGVDPVWLWLAGGVALFWLLKK